MIRIGTFAAPGAIAALMALGAARPGAGTSVPAGVPSICAAMPAETPAPSSRGAVTTDEPGPSAYYAVDLVTTKKIPATGRARGVGHVTFAASPFGVALAPDGSYLYDVDLQLQEMGTPSAGTLVAWVTTTEVDQIRRLGAFDDQMRVSGQVGWNKFLVVVTLEASDDPSQETWAGPIALRGMSRSGMMHTMAGHGPFQQELCARYGYR